MPPTPFDPCKQWLGIDAVDLVDPRRVLGISRTETDAETVRRAAQARRDRLRRVEPGPFEVARDALLKRVDEALDTVLTDLTSSARSGTPRPDRLSMPPPPGGAVMPPHAGVPSVPRVPPVPTVPRPAAAAGGTSWPAAGDAPPLAPAIEIRRPVVYRKKSSGGGVLLFLIVGLAAAAGGLYWYKLRGPQAGAKPARTDVALIDAPPTEPARVDPPVTPPPPQPRRTPRPKRGPTPSDQPTVPSEPDPVRKPSPEPEPEPAPEPDPVPPPPPERPPRPEPSSPPPAMTEDPRAIDALLGKVVAALRKADFPAAAEEARAAVAAAQTEASRARGERWSELVTFAAGFADYRTQALATVSPGMEFDIDGKKIIVVEIDDEKFVYRFAGKNRTTPRDRIPGGILMAIVTGWFDATPANDLFIGAYHATKEEPDLDKARASWEKAAAGGADASLLLPLLDDPLLATPE